MNNPIESTVKKTMAAAIHDFQFACKLSELQPNHPHTIEVEDRFVIVVLLEGKVYCIEDLCTHDGGTFGDGELEGNCIVCPRHGAKFDVRTGAAACMPATEPTLSHEVEVRNDEVYVRLRENV
jgi:3-phenylpropionate/trans-cinnamate dioxygenase ferredoxin component